jgi:hypothetical protein
MKFFNKNWKTTLAGIITVIIQVGPVVAPKIITHDLANAITAVAISLGLIAAKDGNVTGGTVQQ